MKKRTLISAITISFLLLTINLISQPCLPEGITFTTQAQIDSFQINYPGCTEIEGDVEIYGDYITNLNGLNVLTSIGGYLWIGSYWTGGMPNLASLSGLDNLSSIGGDLWIVQNNNLSNFLGLGNLAIIGGELYISENEALSSLIGLEGLTAIEVIRISENATLTSLTGLENLTSIGGVLGISNNPSLASLTSLENLS